MKTILTFILFFSSLALHASWFCREASSQAQGNHFYSCGVAESKTLYQARKQSLINAKEEFKAFCNESPNCRNREYIITPMRTDCRKKDDKFICYRGLDYRILEEEKSFDALDLDDIKREIRIKENKLRELEEKYNNLQYLQQLNNNIAEFDTMDTLEVELDKLNEIKKELSRPLPNKGGFQVFYLSIPLPYGNQPIIGLGPEYERLIFSDFLGIKFNFNYVMSTDSKPEIDDRGTPNSISSPDYHSHKGVDASISIPIHIKSVSIGPKFGHTSLKYKSTTKSYNNFGVNQGTQIERHHFNDNYMGLCVRYEDRFYIEIEPRKYLKSKDTQIKYGIGLSIDF
jgi:hypothetical protein